MNGATAANDRLAARGAGVMAAGRPRGAESKRRRDEFLRLVLDGVDPAEAAKTARVKPERALALLGPIVRPLLAKAAA